MRRFRFDRSAGHAITQYDSRETVITGIQSTSSAVQIGCMRIGPGGVVGYHQANSPQLFLMVAGSGWVSGTDRAQHPLQEGYAAFWDAGEWHESGSETGATVIVIEGDTLNPEQFMREDPFPE